MSWFHRYFGTVRRTIAERRRPVVQTKGLQDDDPQRYLDPQALVRFGLTPLIARKVVEGFINGLHKSPFHGFSVEFADHREYVPGDDLKFLDWFLFARTDHYYVKRYEEETNVRCHILLDRSGSMAFGTTGVTKWDYGCFLCSCLAYLMIKQQDATGVILCGDRQGLAVPPRCRGSHLNQIMRLMINNPAAGTTALATSLRAIVHSVKRRSLLVLISDLIDDPEETLRAIKLLSTRRHEVIVFHVLDAAEIELNFDGATLFSDLETGEEMEVDVADIRASYQEHVRQIKAFYSKGLTSAGIDYQVVDTRTPYEHALWAYLQKRAALAK